MVGWWGGEGGGVDLGSFSSSFIASMLYIRFSCGIAWTHIFVEL